MPWQRLEDKASHLDPATPIRVNGAESGTVGAYDGIVLRSGTSLLDALINFGFVVEADLSGIQIKPDDVRYCDRSRAGVPHEPHLYEYLYIRDDGAHGTGHYWCDGESLYVKEEQ